MTLKQYSIITGIVVFLAFWAGCNRTSSPRVAQNLDHASDIRKAGLERELAKKWDNPVAHYELGQLYHASGDWSKADYYYDNALGSNPAHRDAQAAKVKMQLDKGDRSKSEYLANMYMTQVSSSPEQLLLLGEAFEKQGLTDYALKCYKNALTIAPDSYKVNRQLGYYYLARGKKDQAKEYFIRSFNLNSNQPDVAGELGRLGVVVKIPEAPAPGSENLSQPVRPANQPK